MNAPMPYPVTPTMRHNWPLLRTIYVGRCPFGRDHVPGYPQHTHMAGRGIGSICVTSDQKWTLPKDRHASVGVLFLHEYAHLMSLHDHHHGWRWRRAMTKLGLYVRPKYRPWWSRWFYRRALGHPEVDAVPPNRTPVTEGRIR